MEMEMTPFLLLMQMGLEPALSSELQWIQRGFYLTFLKIPSGIHSDSLLMIFGVPMDFPWALMDTRETSIDASWLLHFLYTLFEFIECVQDLHRLPHSGP